LRRSIGTCLAGQLGDFGQLFAAEGRDFIANLFRTLQALARAVEAAVGGLSEMD
jgi:hypothetical protein